MFPDDCLALCMQSIKDHKVFVLFTVVVPTEDVQGDVSLLYVSTFLIVRMID